MTRLKNFRAAGGLKKQGLENKSWLKLSAVKRGILREAGYEDIANPAIWDDIAVAGRRAFGSGNHPLLRKVRRKKGTGDGSSTEAPNELNIPTYQMESAEKRIEPLENLRSGRYGRIGKLIFREAVDG